MAQHDRLGPVAVAAVADVLPRVREPSYAAAGRDREPVVVDGVGLRVGVGCPVEREVGVEEVAAATDHLVAARLVVALTRREVAVVRNDVGAVERVVERAPAGVDGVGREAGVEQRDDQLGAGDPGDLVVDALGRDADQLGLVEEVADLAEVGLVGLGLGAAGVLPVPVVELRLQLLAPLEQRPLAGREVGE